MPKSILDHIGTCLVLILGLASCARDKHVMDDYHPAPVTVKHGAKFVQSYQVGDGLDLQDYLSVESSHPKHYRVDTECVQGASRSKRTVEINGDSPVSIINLLPTEFAPFDEARLRTIVCSFPITLYNENGSSRRDVHLISQTIVSHQPASIFLDSPLDSWKRSNTFRFSDRNSVNLNISPDVQMVEHGLRLVCDGITSAPLNPRSKLNLSNLYEANLTFDEDIQTRSAKPFRSCRFIMGTEQSISAMSNDFKLLLDWEPIKVSIVREQKLNQEQLQGFMNGQLYHFVTYSLFNPTGADRRLRIPRYRIDLNILGWGGSWAHHQNHPWGRLEIIRDTDHEPVYLRMENDYLEYALPPGERIALDVVFQNTHDLRVDCTIGGDRRNLPNFIFEPHWNYQVQVSDESGNFSTLELPRPQPHESGEFGSNAPPELLNQARSITPTVQCPAD